jgi:hypothetical protein
VERVGSAGDVTYFVGRGGGGAGGMQTLERSLVDPRMAVGATAADRIEWICRDYAAYVEREGRGGGAVEGQAEQLAADNERALQQQIAELNAQQLQQQQQLQQRIEAEKKALAAEKAGDASQAKQLRRQNSDDADTAMRLAGEEHAMEWERLLREKVIGAPLAATHRTRWRLSCEQCLGWRLRLAVGMKALSCAPTYNLPCLETTLTA